MKKSKVAMMLAGVLSHGFVLLVGVYCFEKGTALETIGKHTITTAEFETHYETILDQVSRQSNVDKKTIARFVCYPNDPTAINPTAARLIAQQLDPVHAYRQYRDMRMVEQVAREDGFVDKESTQRILKLAELDNLSRLYMQSKIQEDLKFTDEQKIQRCEELRKEDKRFAPLPLDQCMHLAERDLMSRKIQIRTGEIISEIKESIQIKANKEFDKTAYLEKNIQAYNSLRSQGGCGAAPSGDKKDEKKEESK